MTIALVLAAALAPSAPARAAAELDPPRLGEPLGEIVFASDMGPLAPRYLRALDLKVGDRPNRGDLDRAIARLSEWPQLERIELRRRGPVLVADLVDKPVLGLTVVPFPYLWRAALGVGVEDWHWGPCYWAGKAQLNYDWDTLAVYDPAHPDKPPEFYVDNGLNGVARFGLTLLPDLQLQLRDRFFVSELVDAVAPYDPRAQRRGFAHAVGPELRYDNSDSPTFPRLGTRLRLSSGLGSAGGALGEFSAHWAEFQRYSPIGEDSALVTSVSAGLNRGAVPWNFKLDGGGTSYLRGYPVRRFLGDQLLVGTLELRRRFTGSALLKPLLGWTGLSDATIAGSGFWGAAFLDVGRAWDSRYAPGFPQGMRPAAGGYLGLNLGRWNVGRLEVSVGDEGPYLGVTSGIPFDW